MKNKIIVILCAAFTIQSYAQLNTITTTVPFLNIAPDARAAGMGDAGVSSTPDANSLHWNPAKYAFIENNMGLSTSYAPWFSVFVSDIKLGHLSAYRRINDKNTLAMSFLYCFSDHITFTDVIGNTIGQFRPKEFATDIAYSRKLSENFSMGFALRYIYSNLTGGVYIGGAKSQPGQSIATDISAYYQKETGKGNFAFGINISNIGTKISYTESIENDFIPINMRLGPSYKIKFNEHNTLELMIDINKLLVPTPPEYNSAGQIIAGKDPNRSVIDGMIGSFSDAPGGFKEEMHEIMYSFGMEYWHDNMIAIRAGYFYEHPTKGNQEYFSVGLGARNKPLSLDVAYLIPLDQNSRLQNAVRLTLMCNLDSFKKKQKSS